MYNGDSPWDECAFAGTQFKCDNCWTSRFPFGLGLDVFRESCPVSHLLIGVLVLFGERNTSITTSHKSRASKSSIRNPASNEMIPDSVVLWNTDVCFLHIQQIGTKVRLPNMHKIPSMLISSPQGHQQSLSFGTDPIDNAELCCPHDNIDGSLLWWMYEIHLPKCLSQACVHWVTDRAIVHWT